jgi:enoyl-CoA hydratase/carnithine racemase
MENIASGDPFTAERAREVGLLNRVVSTDAVMAEAGSWLKQAARAGAVMATGRPMVYELAQLGYDDALELALSRFSAMFDDEG